MSLKVITPHPKKPLPWLMGKDWPKFWRVRLPDTGKLEEKRAWCRDSILPTEWETNFGGEVFYFLKLEDATLFRLKWEGVT